MFCLPKTAWPPTCETMMVLEGKKYRLVVEVKEEIEIVVPCGPSSSIKLYVVVGS